MKGPVNEIPTISPERVEEIHRNLVDDKGILILRPSQFYRDNYSFDELRVWMHFKGVYGLPTQELCTFLEEQMGNWKKRSIEVGAGNGWLGHHLGIPMFDNKFQARLDVKLFYAINRQPVIKYPDFVTEMDGLDAVVKYKPHTVIMQWVTQKVTSGDSIDKAGCCGGLQLELLLQKVKQLILVGSPAVHGTADLMQAQHTEHEADWILSRNPRNIIYIWNNKKWTP